MLLKRVVHLVLNIFFVFFVSACVARPAYSPTIGECFISKPIDVARIAVVASMPSEFTEKIAVPLTTQFVNVFKQNGVDARSEIQVTNSLALGYGVNFAQALRFKPHAFLIIKLAGGRSIQGSDYGEWKLIFDLFDEKGRGVWRGSATLRRLIGMQDTSEQIAKEVLQKLMDDQAIKILPQGTMI